MVDSVVPNEKKYMLRKYVQTYCVAKLSVLLFRGK